MQKRGQVTLFVIIGIVILVTIGIIVYFASSSTGKQGKSDIIQTTKVSDDISEIKNSLDICLEEKASESLDYISYYGGYIYETPEYIVNFRGNEVAYGFYQGEFLYPTLEDMEKEMINYIVYNFDSCIATEDYAYQFDIQPPSVHVKIEEDKVNFIINYQFILTKDKESYEVKDKSEFNKNVRLGYLYKLMQSITTKEYEVGYVLDMDYLFSLDNKIYIYELDNKTLIYRLADLPGRPYLNYNYTFANKF